MDTHEQWAELLAAADVGPCDGAGVRAVRLAQAVALGVDVGPGVTGCSVTVMVGAGFLTLAGSTSTAWALDSAQYHAGRGPCVVAARDGRVAGFDLGRDGDRLPGFAAAVLARGVQSLLSMPPRGRGLGVNVYSAAPDAFDAQRSRAVASLLARCVAGILDGRDTSGVGGPAGSREEPARARSRGEVVARDERRSILDIAAQVSPDQDLPRSPMRPPEQPPTLEQGMRASQLSWEQLWLRQLEVGGSLSALEVEGYVLGLLPPDRHSHDLIARALDEHWVRQGQGSPVAY